MVVARAREQRVENRMLIDELKVLEKEIVDAVEDADEITKIFIEATEREVNLQEALSRADKFLS